MIYDSGLKQGHSSTSLSEFLYMLMTSLAQTLSQTEMGLFTHTKIAKLMFDMY